MGFKLPKADTFKNTGNILSHIPYFPKGKKLPCFEGKSFVSGMDVLVDFWLGYSWTLGALQVH